MTIARTQAWRDAFALFEELLPRDDKTRASELAKLASSNPELHAHVVALFDADEKTETSIPGARALKPTESRAGTVIDDYLLERELGSGGMGEVWLAKRRDGVSDAPVALKLLHAHLSRSGARDRFLREGKILGELTHPNVARLLDAGVSESGQPFLALEYVEGERLDRWCDARKLDVNARVKLFLQVCDAVAHAHAHLVVHRDLKPSNILVSQDGEVKLLDFGIAKLVQEDSASAAETELTRASGRALTPEYAAPEQILGAPITVATDVYSLGVILYLLLSGQRPYGQPGQSQAQLEREVLETEPAPPSRVGENKALQGDLDTIILKALKKTPAERYASVVAFSDDLQRYLEHRPVLARPDSFAYRATKFVRRNRSAVSATAALVLVSLVILAAAAHWAKLQRAQLQFQHRLESLVTLARNELRLHRNARAAAYLGEAYSRGLDTAALHYLLGRALPPVEALSPRAIDTGGQITAIELTPDGNGVLAASGSGSASIWDFATGTRRVTLDGAFPAYPNVAFSRDGARVLFAGVRSATVQTRLSKAWDATTGRALVTMDGTAGNVACNPAFLGSDPAMTRAVTVTETGDARVWDLATGSTLRSLKMPGEMVSAVFNPDGTRILGSDGDDHHVIWDARTGAELGKFRGRAVPGQLAYFTPGGEQVITFDFRGSVKLWDARRGELLDAFGGRGSEPACNGFSPDGKLLTTIDSSGLVVHDLETGAVKLNLDTTPDFQIHAFNYSPDGARLVTAHESGFSVWDVATQELLGSFDGHPDYVFNAVFTPEGRELLSASYDGTIRRWDVSRPRGEVIATFRHEGVFDTPKGIVDVAFDPSGEKLLTAATDRVVRIWDARTHALLNELKGHAAPVQSARFSPDGKQIASGGSDGTVRLWDVASAKEIAKLDSQTHELGKVRFSADGAYVAAIGASASTSPVIEVWDAHRGQLIGRWQADAQAVLDFAMTPDGERIVTVGSSSAPKLWTRDGKPLLELDSKTPAGSVSISDDGARLLTIDGDKSAHLWDAASGRLLLTFDGADAGILQSAEFAPTGDIAVIGANGGAVFKWDLKTGARTPLPGAVSAAGFIRFSRDGSKVAAVGGGFVTLWNADDGELLGSFGQSWLPINAIDFSPDGESMLVGRPNKAEDLIYAQLVDLHSDRRTAAEISKLVACKSPWRVDGEKLVQRAPDPHACEQ